MNPKTQEKLVRDLEVGDKLHPSTFDLSEAPSPVTITSINPYGTSYHSLIINGDYEWDNGETHSTGPLVFDKLTKVQTV